MWGAIHQDARGRSTDAILSLSGVEVCASCPLKQPHKPLYVQGPRFVPAVPTRSCQKDCRKLSISHSCAETLPSGNIEYPVGNGSNRLESVTEITQSELDQHPGAGWKLPIAYYGTAYHGCQRHRGHA